MTGRSCRSCVLLLLVVACGTGKDTGAQRQLTSAALVDSINRARQDSVNRATPGYVIDSILTVDEEVRRFKSAIGGQPVTALQHASISRDALARRFVTALASGDSSDMRAMALTAREFIDLVYPESPYTRPPYRQSPGLVWNQIQNPSASGLSRLVRRLGGQAIDYHQMTCDARPDRQGANTLWTNCIVSVGAPGTAPTRHRLFGSIIERDGRYKIVSFRNEF